jgi:hypothetical protein
MAPPSIEGSSENDARTSLPSCLLNASLIVRRSDSSAEWARVTPARIRLS